MSSFMSLDTTLPCEPVEVPFEGGTFKINVRMQGEEDRKPPEEGT